MIQQVHKLFIPKGTIMRNYHEFDNILKNVLDELHINSNITDDNVVLHIGITVGKAEAGATVRPEVL